MPIKDPRFQALASALGGRVQHYRHLRSLTQNELAIKVGVQPSQVQRWERGTQAPHASFVLLLARALGTSADVLLGGA